MAANNRAIFIMIQRKYLYSYFIIALIALALIWLIYNFNNHHTKQLTQSKTQANAIVKNITSTRFNATGHIKSQLISPKLIHYTKDNSTTFITPHITIYSPNKKPWIITAKKGFAENGTNKIILKNNVLLHQSAGKNNQETTITTSELTLYSNQQIAKTNKEVTIVQIAKDKSKNIIKSVGVIANQKTGIIKLVSHARGYYEPAG